MRPMLASIHAKHHGGHPAFESSRDKLLTHTLRTTGRLPALARAVGLNPAEARNKVVADFLADGDSDCLVMVDDDQVLPSDALLRLTSALDQSPYAVVAPLILKVAPPFQTVAWGIVDGLLTPFLPWGRTGLHEVAEVGTGVVAIRKEVFVALGSPWFRVGQVRGYADQLMEDVDFARRAREAGFRIGLDVDHAVGHATGMFVVWPDVANGCVVLAGGDGHKLAIPHELLAAMPAPQPAAVGR